MTRQPRNWRIRLAFEPNRFSGEQLERIYEQLKPTEMRATSESSHTKRAATKHRAAKRGDQ
jgi:hypothetical protein